MVGVILVIGTCFVTVVIAYVFVGKDRSLRLLSSLGTSTYSLMGLLVSEIRRRSKERSEALKAREESRKFAPSSVALANIKPEPTNGSRKKKSATAMKQSATTGRNYDVSVSGTSHYQEALEHVCGGRTGSSANKEASAELHYENDNEFDRQAVRVMIDGMKVGYLSRDDARQLRKSLRETGLKPPIGVHALIVGGWYRGDDDRGHFGVRLELFEG